MRTARTVESKIREKIRKSERTVFLRGDFAADGSYRHVGRILRKLMDQGRLARIGQGLYAKTRSSQLSGRQMLDAPGGFDQVAKEALNLLGVNWQPSRAETAYQEGLTTQVPVNSYIRVPRGFKREIAFGNFRLEFEPQCPKAAGDFE